MKVHIPSTLWIILVEFDLVFVASYQSTVKSLYYGKSLILCFVTFPVFFLIHFNNLYFSQETFLLNDVLIINSLIFFGLVRFYTLLVIFWLKLYRTFLWNDSTLVSFISLIKISKPIYWWTKSCKFSAISIRSANANWSISKSQILCCCQTLKTKVKQQKCPEKYLFVLFKI